MKKSNTRRGIIGEHCYSASPRTDIGVFS